MCLNHIYIVKYFVYFFEIMKFNNVEMNYLVTECHNVFKFLCNSKWICDSEVHFLSSNKMQFYKFMYINQAMLYIYITMLYILWKHLCSHLYKRTVHSPLLSVICFMILQIRTQVTIFIYHLVYTTIFKINTTVNICFYIFMYKGGP
jgi:hypothetical protein